MAYIGPETMLPLASVIAAIVGSIMLMGRRLFAFLRLGLQSVVSTVFRRRRA